MKLAPVARDWGKATSLPENVVVVIPLEDWGTATNFDGARWKTGLADDVSDEVPPSDDTVFVVTGIATDLEGSGSLFAGGILIGISTKGTVPSGKGPAGMI